MNETKQSSDSSTVIKVFGIAVLVVIIVMVAGMPNFIPDRRTSPKNECINNLRLIDGAEQTWALDHNRYPTDTPSWADILPYLGHTNDGWTLKCPLGGTYTLGAVSNKPSCSIPGHALP